MGQRRLHIVLEDELIEDIDRRVGARARSRFFSEAARLHLAAMRQREALDMAAGAWGAEEHPELDEGSAAYVQRLRAEDASAREASRS
jgi:hypothetical protein